MARVLSTIDVFHAVADATRRQILDLLADGERAVSEVVSAFRISQPAISKHLRILREVGLVSARDVGRQRVYSLDPEQLRIVAQWIAHYERFWDQHLDQLDQFLQKSRQSAGRKERDR